MPFSTQSSSLKFLSEPNLGILRLIGMSSATVENQKSLKTLQVEYRRAWHFFTAEFETFQAASNTSDETVLRARVETAASDYRDARNALAQQLLDDQQSAHSRSPVAIDEETETRSLAVCAGEIDR